MASFVVGEVSKLNSSALPSSRCSVTNTATLAKPIGQLSAAEASVYGGMEHRRSHIPPFYRQDLWGELQSLSPSFRPAVQHEITDGLGRNWATPTFVEIIDDLVAKLKDEGTRDTGFHHLGRLMLEHNELPIANRLWETFYAVPVVLLEITSKYHGFAKRFLSQKQIKRLFDALSVVLGFASSEEPVAMHVFHETRMGSFVLPFLTFRTLNRKPSLAEQGILYQCLIILRRMTMFTVSTSDTIPRHLSWLKAFEPLLFDLMSGQNRKISPPIARVALDVVQFIIRSHSGLQLLCSLKGAIQLLLSRLDCILQEIMQSYSSDADAEVARRRVACILTTYANLSKHYRSKRTLGSVLSQGVLFRHWHFFAHVSDVEMFEVMQELRKDLNYPPDLEMNIAIAAVRLAELLVHCPEIIPVGGVLRRSHGMYLPEIRGAALSTIQPSSSVCHAERAWDATGKEPMPLNFLQQKPFLSPALGPYRGLAINRSTVSSGRFSSAAENLQDRDLISFTSPSILIEDPPAGIQQAPLKITSKVPEAKSDGSGALHLSDNASPFSVGVESGGAIYFRGNDTFGALRMVDLYAVDNSNRKSKSRNAIIVTSPPKETTMPNSASP